MCINRNNLGDPCWLRRRRRRRYFIIINVFVAHSVNLSHRCVHLHDLLPLLDLFIHRLYVAHRIILFISSFSRTLFRSYFRSLRPTIHFRWLLLFNLSFLRYQYFQRRLVFCFAFFCCCCSKRVSSNTKPNVKPPNGILQYIRIWGLRNNDNIDTSDNKYNHSQKPTVGTAKAAILQTLMRCLLRYELLLARLNITTIKSTWTWARKSPLSLRQFGCFSRRIPVIGQIWTRWQSIATKPATGGKKVETYQTHKSKSKEKFSILFARINTFKEQNSIGHVTIGCSSVLFSGAHRGHYQKW